MSEKKPMVTFFKLDPMNRKLAYLNPMRYRSALPLPGFGEGRRGEVGLW